jgi:phage terminase Nu1 subunit (DNA packaging protein)
MPDEIISSEEAVKLLLLDNAPELAVLAKAGWFKRIEKNKWNLLDLVHGRIRQLQQAADVVTTGRLTTIFGCHATQIEKLEREGWIKREGVNQWSIIKTIGGVMRYYLDPSRRAVKSTAETRVSAARAREIELRTARRAGELCETEEAIAFADDVFGMVRSDFSGLPAMVTRDLNIRRDIEKAVNDILNRISARLVMQSNALAKSGEITTGPTSLDA